MMLIRTRVAPSRIHGQGLFVVEPVAKGTGIWRFEPGFDRAFAPEQVAAWPEVVQEHLRWFSFMHSETGQYVLSGDHACFMNHSEHPNTGAPQDGSWDGTTVAYRDLVPGDEITCDYRSFDADTAWKLGWVPKEAAWGTAQAPLEVGTTHAVEPRGA